MLTFFYFASFIASLYWIIVGMTMLVYKSRLGSNGQGLGFVLLGISGVAGVLSLMEFVNLTTRATG